MAGLRIEPLRQAHAEALFTALSDVRLYTFMPSAPYDSVESLAEHFGALERGSGCAQEQWLNWVMWDGEQPVGTLQTTVQADGVALIAYMVFARHQRRGHARHGCRWLLDRLAANGSVSIARALIDTRNAASIGLVEALGFQRIATIQAADHFKGATSDEFVYERTVGSAAGSTTA